MNARVFKRGLIKEGGEEEEGEYIRIYRSTQRYTRKGLGS